jgi:hypothetical protein
LARATETNSTAPWRRCAGNGRFEEREILRLTALGSKLKPYEKPQQMSVLCSTRSNVLGYFRGRQAKLPQNGQELPDERQQKV